MNPFIALVGADTSGVEIQFFPNDSGGSGPVITQDNAPVNNANDTAQTNDANDNIEVGS